MKLIFLLRLFLGLCWPLATSIAKGWSLNSILQLVQVNICQISKNQFPSPIKSAKIARVLQDRLYFQYPTISGSGKQSAGYPAYDKITLFGDHCNQRV